jgi:hypothetical protein
MLTVTGTAEFVLDEGDTILKVKVAIQPHVPHEHEVLSGIASDHELLMDHGQLILERSFFVVPHDLVKDLEQTPLSAPSVATSASDPLDHETFMDAYKDSTDK